MLDSDKQALIDGTATIPYRITIIGETEEDNVVLTENDIVSTTYEDYRYVNTSSLVVGQFVARTLTGEIKDVNKSLEIENKEIKVELGVKTKTTTNYYSLGNFLITKPEDDDVKDKTSFKSMDYTKKFNKEFDANDLVFPCSALELAQYCCDKCGVELATVDFTNSDFIVENNQYETGDTYRKVMQDIGKLAYSWIRIGWDNKCYIDFSTPSDDVNVYNKIGTGNYYDLTSQKLLFGPVNRVVIGMADVEGENVYVEDTDSISANGLCELQILDNNLTYTPELRQKVIDSARKLFGLKFIPLESNTTGHPWLVGNELIEFETLNGEKLQTIPFDRTIEYKGHIKSKITSKADTRIETEYKNPGTLENEIRKTRIIVDKQNQTISSIVSTTEQIVQDNTNLSNKVEQNSNSIQTLSTVVTQNNASVTTKIEEIVKNLEDGVETLKNTLVTINIKGISVTTNTSAISTLLSNDRFSIKSKNEELFFVGYDYDLKKTVSRIDNLTVTNYFTAGYHRQEKFDVDFEKRTGWFFIGE